MWFPGRNRFRQLVDEKKAEERFAGEVRPELEKGDLPAMIIAALIVFMPPVLIAIGVLWLFTKLLGG